RDWGKGRSRGSVGNTGLWAQPRLQEAGGGLRAPGDSVTLSCRGSGFTFEDYFVDWYRQEPGGRFEWVSWISHYSSQIRFGSAVKGRATASRDNSHSLASLSLYLLHAGDCARYFCAQWKWGILEGHLGAQWENGEGCVCLSQI
uniref:Ig-like domain-containing protein n=1 Tax=Ficedula albicollis TaxID=59894 RepID=A0A803V3B3_FICAL